MTAAELWSRLAAEGFVDGDMPTEAPASPWYVRVMLGIAGWIGAIFLLMFVGFGFQFVIDNAVACFIVGAICCTIAWLLFRSFPDNDFLEQFALVISLVGQGLLGAGLGQSMKEFEAPFYFALAGVECALALLIPNFLHRVLTTGAAAVALALGINELELQAVTIPLLCLILAWIWLEPKRWAAGGRIWRPVGYGLVLALLLVETFRMFGWQHIFDTRPVLEPTDWFALYGPLFGRAVTAAVLVGTALVLARREAAPGSRLDLVAAGAALLLGLVSLNAPGLASALLILLLGFSAGNRLLMALGILSLLGFVSHYYYSLHATLLEKSGLLAVTGLCLLAAHMLLRRRAPAPTAGEAQHA